MLGHPIYDLPLGRYQSGHGLDYDVIAGKQPLRPLASEGGVVAIDETGILPRQGLVVHAQLVRDIRAIVGDNHVHLRQQLVHYLLPFPATEVQREASLAPVDGQEGAALQGHELLVKTPGVSPRRLHLDDIRAHIRQEHPAEGGGYHLGQFEDLDSI